MKLPRFSIASRLALTVLILVALSGIGFGIVIQSLSSTESVIRNESSEHVELLTVNSVVSRQVFELTTRVRLLEQAFLYNESVLSEEGFNIDSQLQKMRELSSDKEFSAKMDAFIEDFQRFLGNSLTLNRIIREMKLIDNALATQLNQLDFAVSESRLAQVTEAEPHVNNNYDLVNLLRESFLTIGKRVGTIRSRITPETEKVVIIEVQKELDILQLHLTNVKDTSPEVKKEKSKLRRQILKYNAALRKMQANLEQRWTVMAALVDSQNALLNMVVSTESNVQNSALDLTQKLEQDISRSRINVLFIAVITVLTGLILTSRVVRKHIQDPLKQLSHGIQRLESTEMDQRIHLGRHDEWNTIEKAFNNMANKLEESYSQLTLEKKNFNFLAHHDPLTGLANRLLITDQLETLIQKSQRKQRHFALLYLDVDEFKTVHDSLGHAIGDKLLVDFSVTLQELIGQRGEVARMGGDEFMVLLPNVASLEEATTLASEINQSVRKPYFLENRTVFVSSSIGVCLFPQHGQTVDMLIRNADTAMYHAKRSGRDCYAVYEGSMTSEAHDLMDISAGLRQALNNHEFELLFQPQIDLITGRIFGAEALIRWNHPTLGYLTPYHFLEVAEKTGIIVEIDNWVFNRVADYIRGWIEQGVNFESLSISVNFSGRKFYSEDLVQTLKETLKDKQCMANHITLEITERDMMTGVETSMDTINALRELGFSIAIDDFGTGHSSLALLKNLPADIIKLDKSFIDEIATSERDLAIVQSVMQLAQKLNLEVVAEGIETLEQTDRLLIIGCEQGQGYYYSKPISAEKWLLMIQQQQKPASHSSPLDYMI